MSNKKMLDKNPDEWFKAIAYTCGSILVVIAGLLFIDAFGIVVIFDPPPYGHN